MHCIRSLATALISISSFSTALLGLSAAPVRADAVKDGGFWLNIVTQGDLGPGPVTARIKWWLDGQLRLFEDSGGFGQGLVRPGVGYALGGSTSVWAGYAFIRTDPTTGSDFDEQRIWQQFLWSPKFEAFSLDLRSRLEERFLQTGSDVGVRFRQLVGGRLPLDFAPRITPMIWNEVFFNLNDTDWTAPRTEAGFDQNRFFVGLGFKLEREARLRLDAGYMNQYIRRPGNQDLSNNLFSLTLQWNFGSRPGPATPAEPTARTGS